MNTKKWIVDNFEQNLIDEPTILEASKMLKEDEVIAFPTETVYGLGANARSELAAQKIFRAKGRPSDNPLIVHISERKQVDELALDISKEAQLLMEKFWPGPLTIILNRKGDIAPSVTAGLATIAIRMPDHPIALALISRSGCPLAAPSANKSGKPSPTTASHVFEDLNGEIAGIIDGGQTGVGVESTVIDCTGEQPAILRPGGITKLEIEAVIGEVEIDPALKNKEEAPKSPGMKYAHYAPDAPMIIVNGSNDFMQHMIEEYQSKGKKVGVLTTEENKSNYQAEVVLACGSRMDLQSVARSLYQTLRTFNESQLDVILCESFPVDGVGEALMNRLNKAAGGHIITQ